MVGPRSPPPCTVADVILELGPEHVVDITHRSVVMGILNRTTDSFFDQGRHWDFDAFLRLAERQVAEGADILDVGGIRAAPGPEVTAASEVDRVVPAVEALRERFDLPISVDTFRGSVIEEALAAGACIGNDISGFADPHLPRGLCTPRGLGRRHPCPDRPPDRRPGAQVRRSPS